MRFGVLVLLSLILLGGLFLRTHRLSERGLMLPDEIGYYSSAANVAIHARFWATGESRTLSGDERRERWMESMERVGADRGFFHRTKPFYGFLASFFFILLGPSHLHLLMVNALFGGVTVGAVYWLARRLGGTETGALLSGLALAVSGFHLIWSRSMMAQGAATFFLVLGMASYARAIWGSRTPSRMWLLVSGLSLGAGFTTHPIIGFYIVVCGASEGYRMLRGGGIRRGLANLIALGLGFGFVVGLMQLLVWSAGNRLLPEFSWLYGEEIGTYFGGLFQAKVKVADSVRAPNLHAKLSAYGLMPFVYGEGVIYSLLAAAGLALAMLRYRRRWSSRDFFLVAVLLLPLILFSTVKVKAFARNMAPLAPVLALFVGLSLEALWTRFRSPGWRVAWIGLFAVIQWFHLAYIFDLQNGYAHAADWLLRSGGNYVVFAEKSLGGSRLYTNGFKSVYRVRYGRDDGTLAAYRHPWVRGPLKIPVLLSGGGPGRYVGFVEGDIADLLENNKAWLSRFDFSRSVAEFSHPRVFTQKKIGLLSGIRWTARKTGLGSVVNWSEKELKKEESVVANGTLRFYGMKSP